MFLFDGRMYCTNWRPSASGGAWRPLVLSLLCLAAILQGNMTQIALGTVFRDVSVPLPRRASYFLHEKNILHCLFLNYVAKINTSALFNSSSIVSSPFHTTISNQRVRDH